MYPGVRVINITSWNVYVVAIPIDHTQKISKNNSTQG
jgi:hypothetical protein